MKKITPIMFLLLLKVGCPAKVCASDGDVFTATTTEGVEMTFMVISESKKTCQVGDGREFSAVDYGTEKVTIPSSVQGYKVTTIGENAFDYCEYITSVTIPSSVTRIEANAFSRCIELTSIAIPTNVNYIGESAFWGCTALTTVNIPSKVTVIECGTFDGCSSLKAITIPTSITTIGDLAFNDCSSLAAITIPANVDSIGNNVFNGCESLTSMRVSTSNKRFDSRDYCNAIIETTTNTLIAGCVNTVIPSTVTSIGEWAFYRCNNLKKIEIPESVISIGACAFYRCSSLLSVSIPDGVINIGASAFAYCSNLVTIKIPSSVTNFKTRVLMGCSSLESIVVEEGNNVYDSRNNCNAIIETETNTLISGCMNTEIPDGVAVIAEYAFSFCSSLYSIKIPKSVIKIGSYAFERTGLYHITIPKSVTEIGSGAFQKCSSLGSIYSGVKRPFEVSKSTFKDIPNTTTLYVPNNTKEAYATTEGWPHDNIKEFVVSNPDITMGSNGVTIKSGTTGADIYYTTDGSTPTAESTRYKEPFWPSERCVIKAIATFDDVFDSEVVEYRPTCTTPEAIYDGHSLALSTTTNGATIHYTTDGNVPTMESPVYTGKINVNGICTFKAVALRDALYDSPVLTYTLPFFYDGNSIRLSQNGTLEDAAKVYGMDMEEFSSVIWEGEAIPAGRFACVTNPNLLLYVKQLPYAANAKADGVKNVIANGHAESITLTDAKEGTGNFYCPEAFTADQITYTHEYQMETGINECRGWETLTLPFDVETVTHETKGELTPMAINDPDKAPFWLDELTESGFTPASAIKAYKPYIISMPNNDAYGNEYKLNGRVTFSAHNAFVGMTEPQNATKGNVTLTPCFNRQAESAQIFVINAGTTYHGLPEGSTFVPNLRTTRPFEAYVTSDSNNARYYSISDFRNTDTSIIPIQQTMPSFDALYDLGGRKWNGGMWIIKKGCKTWKQK